MKTAIRRVSLIGTSRIVELNDRLNVVVGSITSGKTSFMRLARALLGGNLEGLAPEVRQGVVAIGGDLVLDNLEFTVVRPNVTTADAPVDIAGPDDFTARLPASRSGLVADATYGQFLLDRLGLPRLEVPSAPTVAESAPSPLTINDYMLYCDIEQDQIDSSVFSHTHTFKNIKRRYVFEVIFGIYDLETAALQERLREVSTRLRLLTSESSAFESFLAGTELENYAALESQLHETEADLEREINATVQLARRESSIAQPFELRSAVLELDASLASLREDLRREQAALEDLQRLVAQLKKQSQRLTKAIVADELLVDFEFVVCPRCGTSLEPERSTDVDKCLLCLQQPSPSVDRDTLIGEQARVEAQIAETLELIALREADTTRLSARIALLERRRTEAGSRLDVATTAFVSDNAGQIAEGAAARSRLESRARQLREYIGLHGKFLAARGEINELQNERAGLEDQLRARSADRSESEARIQQLEDRFAESLSAIGVPRFADPPTSVINRRTYMPEVDGRTFEELSSQGLKVLVNVALAIALHRTVSELGLLLPGILMLDGPSSNVGHEGFDQERVDDLYAHLIRTSEELGDSLQIIVADNDIPSSARPFVRLELGPDDRLIPAEALEANSSS